MGRRIAMRRLIVAALLAGSPTCARPQPAPPTWMGPPSQWTEVFAGIEYMAWHEIEPRPLWIHAVRIDLRHEGMRFRVTESNGPRRLDTDSETTSAFLTRTGCDVAVNASPFEPVRHRAGWAQNVRGLSVASGDRYSPQNGEYASLVITKNNRARIVGPKASSKSVADAHEAVVGFELLRRDGVDVSGQSTLVRGLHPRSAVGLDAEAHHMILVVVDGRQSGYSEGMSLPELSALMEKLGAHDALNFDGGGSSSLAVKTQDGVRVVSSPIDRKIPGRERPVGNNLAVCASSPPEPSPG